MLTFEFDHVVIRDLSATGVAIFFDDKNGNIIKANYYYNTFRDRAALKEAVPAEAYQRILDVWSNYPVLKDDWMTHRPTCK